MKTKSTVRVDQAKNRIYLILDGFHDLEEALRMRDLYRAAIRKCRPGFTVLADVTTYRPGPAEIQNVHAEAVKMAERAGVSRVARVVGITPLGGMQIDRIAKSEGAYVSQNFRTVDDAERFLDAEDET